MSNPRGECRTPGKTPPIRKEVQTQGSRSGTRHGSLVSVAACGGQGRPARDATAGDRGGWHHGREAERGSGRRPCAPSATPPRSGPAPGSFPSSRARTRDDRGPVSRGRAGAAARSDPKRRLSPPERQVGTPVSRPEDTADENDCSPLCLRLAFAQSDVAAACARSRYPGPGGRRLTTPYSHKHARSPCKQGGFHETLWPNWALCWER